MCAAVLLSHLIGRTLASAPRSLGATSPSFCPYKRNAADGLAAAGGEVRSGRGSAERAGETAGRSRGWVQECPLCGYTADGGTWVKPGYKRRSGREGNTPAVVLRRSRA